MPTRDDSRNVAIVARLIAMLLGCALFSACGSNGSSSASGSFFPTYGSTGGPSAGALLRGELVASDGCLFWDAGERGRWLPLWPQGYSLGEDPTAVVTDDGTALSVGETAELGGGGTELEGEEWAEERIGEPVPEACRTNRYWLVSAIHFTS